ncbi:MAG: transposase [Alphaproteobacteria bacterium]
MSRQLRLQFPGAVTHVTSRGNAQQDIFADDADRARFLDLLGREIEQQRWRCHAYCLMDNHYHLIIETPDANLSRGMGRLNMAYAQGFNRRHGRNGHLFQGRFHAIIVEKDSHLLELCRYVVLNPVRAGMAAVPEVWPWSNYRATASGRATGLGDTDWRIDGWTLQRFGGDDADGRRAYRRFVREGIEAASPWHDLRAGGFLGGEKFLHTMTERLRRKSPNRPRGAGDGLGPAREPGGLPGRGLSAAPRRQPTAAGGRRSGQRVRAARVPGAKQDRRRRRPRPRLPLGRKARPKV